MIVPELIFNLHAGEVLQKGTGSRNNTVVLLSENASGSVAMNC